MKIRSAVPDEHEALSRLAYAAKAYWVYSSDQLSIWKSELTFKPETISAWPTWVAEIDAMPVGVVQLNPTVDPCELESLWVHPMAMGRGIGKALLRQALDAARQLGRSEVAIDSDPNAESFYLSCGAVRVGEVPAPIVGQPGRIRPQLRLPTHPLFPLPSGRPSTTSGGWV